MTFSNCSQKTSHAARISKLIIENRFSESNTNGKDNNKFIKCLLCLHFDPDFTLSQFKGNQVQFLS